MGDATPPRIRVGEEAVTEECPEGSDGCFSYEYETCGAWLSCLNPETMTIAVPDTGQRTLLHETAHAIYTVSTWSPYWGSGYEGVSHGTGGHDHAFRCLLLDIYYSYTDDVADDAYQMLRNVCVAAGWASFHMVPDGGGHHRRIGT